MDERCLRVVKLSIGWMVGMHNDAARPDDGPLNISQSVLAGADVCSHLNCSPHFAGDKYLLCHVVCTPFTAIGASECTY